MDASKKTDGYDIGARVREWRSKRGLTQAELARAAGITQAALSNYETGKRGLTLAFALRLSSALDITLGHLIGTEEVIVLRDSRIGRAFIES